MIWGGLGLGMMAYRRLEGLVIFMAAASVEFCWPGDFCRVQVEDVVSCSSSDGLFLFKCTTGMVHIKMVLFDFILQMVIYVFQKGVITNFDMATYFL